MKITGFIWLDDIVQKLLWKHSVTQKEVIELFDNSPRLFLLKKETEQARMFMSLSDKPAAEDI